MKGQISKTLRITLLVYTIFLAPGALLHIFGPQTVVAQDQAIERVLGGAMLAFAFGAALAYRDRSWDKVRIVLLMQIAWMFLYTITLAWGVLSKGLLVNAWGSTIIGAVFAILLLFLYIREARLHREKDE